MVKKALVISDTHGSVESFEKIIDLTGDIDFIIHAGDYLYHGPRNRIPRGYNPAKLAESFKLFGDKLIGVKGNCDAEIDFMLMGVSELPAIRFINLNSKKLLVFHGHKPVESEDAVIIIKGHTHIHELCTYKNRIIMNPGSPSLPKDGTPGTFGVIEFGDTVSLYIRDLNGRLIKKETFK